MRHSIDNGDAARSAELHRAQYLAGTAFGCLELSVLTAGSKGHAAFFKNASFIFVLRWSFSWHALHEVHKLHRFRGGAAGPDITLQVGELCACIHTGSAHDITA